MELNLQKFSSLNIEINVFQFLFPAFPICEQSPHNHFYNGSCSHYLTWKHFSLVGVIVLALYCIQELQGSLKNSSVSSGKILLQNLLLCFV